MVAGAFLTNVRLIVEDGLFEMGELLEEMKFLLAIGRIFEIDLGLAFYEDALLMAEGLKAGRAMAPSMRPSSSKARTRRSLTFHNEAVSLTLQYFIPRFLLNGVTLFRYRYDGKTN